MPDSQPEAKEGANDAADAPLRDEKPLPAASEARGERPAPLAPRMPTRNPILAEIVQGEDDLAGLVGYALYKLHKRDWLAAFFKTHGRDPTEGEIESYVLGERTQRRLATYRRLAEDLIGRKAGATIERQGGGVMAGASTAVQRVSAVKANSLRSALTPGTSSAAAGHAPRSAKASLIFWIAVLIVLAATGYYYVNYSSLFLSR
jgi:hypothetical protein